MTIWQHSAHDRNAHIGWLDRQSPEDRQMIDLIVKNEVEHALKNMPMFNWRSRVLPPVKMPTVGKVLRGFGWAVMFPLRVVACGLITVPATVGYFLWCYGVRQHKPPEPTIDLMAYYGDLTIFKLTTWFPDNNEEGK